MPRIPFRDVKVFDGTGSGPFLGEVLVDGERITAVASGGQRIEGDGATIISADGAFLHGLVTTEAL
jgi:N-acyl-D-aspartate/D-glutamate deacylase